MMSVRRICFACGSLQERRDFFERHAVELIHDDVKSCVDEAVAFIALLFEAIACTLRNLSSCIFALHLSIALAGCVHEYVSTADAVAVNHSDSRRFEECWTLFTKLLTLPTAFLAKMVTAQVGLRHGLRS